MLAGNESTTGRTFDRITFGPQVMGGRACIRGMRITIATIIDHLASGRTIEEVLGEYPYLERADIEQALAYAAWLVRKDVVPA